MRIASIATLAAGLLMLLAGCTTPSLNAMATEDTLATDTGLAGQWQEAGKDDTLYIVTAGPDKTYRLLAVPDDADEKPAEFSFHLVRLGSHDFIDMTVPKHAAEELGERHGTTVIPAHVFMKVLREGDELKVWQVSNDWLHDGIKNGTLTLGHALMGEDDNLVLTAPTTELQAFFRKYAPDKKAFEEPMTLKRLAPQGGEVRK
jgi:hypothetical protein